MVIEIFTTLDKAKPNTVNRGGLNIVVVKAYDLSNN
jgi:hypothetical protein